MGENDEMRWNEMEWDENTRDMTQMTEKPHKRRGKHADVHIWMGKLISKKPGKWKVSKMYLMQYMMEKFDDFEVSTKKHELKHGKSM